LKSAVEDHRFVPTSELSSRLHPSVADSGGTSPQQPPWALWVMAGIALFAVAIRFFFWYYTRRTWEDALITVQHAENAARGLGLTHVPGGPHIHGFTSPISVLIPLLGELVHPGFGIPVLKVVSAICGGITVWLAMVIARRLRLALPITFLIGGYLAIEHQQILFGMAGMETQVVVTILLFSIYSLFDLKPIAVGISLGLCLLARPDFSFWVGIVIVLLTWRAWKVRDFHPLEIIGLTLLLVYGPWVAFTTWYYGSPLPNTVLAKAWGYPNHWYAGISLGALLNTLVARIHYLFSPLGPAFGGNGVGCSFLPIDPMGLTCLIVLGFVIRGAILALCRKDIFGIAVTCFILVYSLYYLFMMVAIFLWYIVPLAAVAMLIAGLGFDSALKALVAARWRSIVGYALAGAYLAILAAVAPIALRGEKNIQTIVEDGVRKPVGVFLGNVMGPGETIGAEPLGYFGYYSRRVVFDYPGLCNWQVVRFMREHPDKRTLLDMLAYFQPDYIALRPNEYAMGRSRQDGLLNNYELVKKFAVPEASKRQLLFADRNVDLEFYVLRLRKHSAGTTISSVNLPQ
jgi:hypothetical protein